MPTHFDSGGTRGLYLYPDINALDGATKLSICLWHYQTAAENTGGAGGVSVGVCGKDNQLASPIYMFKNDGGGVLPKVVGFADGSGGTFYGSSNMVADTTWQHFGITYDGSQSVGARGAMYLNGASATKANDNVAASLPSNTNQVLVGSMGGSFSGWAGHLAFVKLWNATLTASEMLLECLYAEPQKTDGLQLYIPMVFNGNAGATYDGTNSLSSTLNTPTTGTVGEPPVKWPAGSLVSRNSPRRVEHAERRDRFQRLGPKRPLVQYG